MDAMPMTGGWTMSMMWTRMPGQTWAGAEASFEAEFEVEVSGVGGVLVGSVLIAS